MCLRKPSQEMDAGRQREQDSVPVVVCAKVVIQEYLETLGKRVKGEAGVVEQKVYDESKQ